MSRDALLLSIRPRFARKILDGTKTIELRRVRPKVEPGHPVLIYGSSPVMALVGVASVGSVICGSPRSVWKHVRGKAGVTRAEFDAYFSGANVAVAIGLHHVERLANAVPLIELRNRWPWFRPPQSYRYVRVRVSRGRGLAALAPRKLPP